MTSVQLRKAATGINGLDEVLHGGLPAGRPTLLCGSAGCGKTVLAMEFLARGARQFGDPGLFVTFEETPPALEENFASLALEITGLVRDRRLTLLHIPVSRGDAIEAGAFTLDALRLRLEHAIATTGAKRVALDGLEALFSYFRDSDHLRYEVGRLLEWLRERQVTAVVTGERAGDELTRRGFEAYLSDCVLLLDHRITQQISRRRLRVVKYRGSSHGKDEYPFLIDERGMSVLPVTSLGLTYTASTGRVSSGVAGLDAMLGGEGYFRGTTMLVSGKGGAGKSSLSASFLAAACARGERCLYFSMEESDAQLARNMRSIGIDMQRWIEAGLLRVRAARPTLRGLEEHLASAISEADEFKPDCVVLDPITSFVGLGAPMEVRSMLLRVIDHFKSAGMTMLLTALTAQGQAPDAEIAHISSLVDTWIVLDFRPLGERWRRELYVIKSRGMAHSLDVREFGMSERGLALQPINRKDPS